MDGIVAIWEGDGEAFLVDADGVLPLVLSQKETSIVYCSCMQQQNNFASRSNYFSFVSFFFFWTCNILFYLTLRTSLSGRRREGNGSLEFGGGAQSSLQKTT